MRNSLFLAPRTYFLRLTTNPKANPNDMAKRAYIEANKRWLEEKSKETGVKSLAKGVMYKVIKQGEPNGASPSPQSIVTVHYTGRTIDGRQFDTSLGGVPLACRLCQLIEGWIIALQQMHVGDKWELYLPAEVGYGKQWQEGIPDGSTLVFEVELLGVG